MHQMVAIMISLNLQNYVACFIGSSQIFQSISWLRTFHHKNRKLNFKSIGHFFIYKMYGNNHYQPSQCLVLQQVCFDRSEMLALQKDHKLPSLQIYSLAENGVNYKGRIYKISKGCCKMSYVVRKCSNGSGWD